MAEHDETDSAPDQARLDALEDHIDEARRQAERDVPTVGGDPEGGMFTDTEPAFRDSGEEHGDQDDQTIAPPG